MTSTEAEIERIESLVRALVAPARGRARTAHAPISHTTAEQVFDGRLLTARLVEGLSEGVKTLVVAPSTVVTPLAREALKKSGVILRFVARGAFLDAGEWGFAIVSERGSGTLVALKRHLLESDWCEVALADEWVAASARRGALIVSDAAARTVWEACRTSNVRAAQVRDVAELERAVRTLGVNLIALEIDGTPLALARSIAESFRKRGAPRVPADLVESKQEACPCGSPK